MRFSSARLAAIGLVIAMTGARYTGDMNTNSEFRAIVKSERNTLITYKCGAIGFCAVAIGAMIVKFCPSFSISNTTLADLLLFICLTSAGGAYYVFGGL